MRFMPPTLLVKNYQSKRHIFIKPLKSQLSALEIFFRHEVFAKFALGNLYEPFPSPLLFSKLLEEFSATLTTITITTYSLMKVFVLEIKGQICS